MLQLFIPNLFSTSRSVYPMTKKKNVKSEFPNELVYVVQTCPMFEHTCTNMAAELREAML